MNCEKESRMNSHITLTTKEDINELIFLMNLDCQIQQEIACEFITVDTGKGHPWESCVLYLEGEAREFFNHLEENCAFARLHTDKRYLFEFKLWDEEQYDAQPVEGVKLAQQYEIGKEHVAHIFENGLN